MNESESEKEKKKKTNYNSNVLSVRNGNIHKSII